MHNNNNAAPKNIILLSDGTGNSSAKLFRTNVWRIYQALDLSAPDVGEHGDIPPRQIAFYDNGVGTSSFRPLALIGGALGIGLKRNVCELYAFLCRNYVPGDRIYCFGYSRGAFTIRMLVALVGLEGILPTGYKPGQVPPNDTDRFAVLAYRKLKARFRMNPSGEAGAGGEDVNLLVKYGRKLRDRVARWRDRAAGRMPYEAIADRHRPTIEFVGLFDTVAAYGLPIDELTRAWGKAFWPLQPDDWDLSSKVGRACHALSLDEPRHTFHPKLWNERREPYVAANIRDERISQVWFPGFHANVGGGNPDDGLALIPLCWMLGEAEHTRLRFKPGRVEQFRLDADVAAPAQNPRRGLGGSYRYNPRKLRDLTRDRENNIFVRRPKVHHSVFDRMAGVQGYAPIGLPAAYSIVEADGRLNAGDGNRFENVADANRRVRVVQEHVWDTVWLRRVVYFLSALVGLVLLFMPLYAGAVPDQICRGPLCDFSVVLNLIERFTPEFLSPWFDAFRAQFNLFVFLLVSATVLIVWGGSLQRDIDWGLDSYWRTAAADPGSQSRRPPKPMGRIYRLRTRLWYKRFFHLLTRTILPWLFVALIAATALWLLFAAVSRTAFVVRNWVSPVCPHVAGTGYAKGKVVSLASGCQAIPIADSLGGEVRETEIEQGVTYQVTIIRQEGIAWADGRIPASLLGLDPRFSRVSMWLGIPLRRALTVDWMQPVLRVGGRWAEEHVLEPVPGSSADARSEDELRYTFTARNSGIPYLYFNDAVIGFLPDPFWPFYANNSGTAQVEIVRQHATNR